MEFLSLAFSKVASGIGPFFLLLGLLIFVHELGHYLVAVFCGVRVETFSLGFGKKLLKYKRGHTTYCLSLIPLGGYVKMFGDDPTAQIPEDQKKYSFLHKPVSQRIAIVLAGPLMNLVFAIFVFGAIGMLGEDVPGPQVGDIVETTEAYKAGFRSGDAVLTINGDSVEQWRDVKDKIEDNADSELVFEVRREGTDEISKFAVTPKWTKNSFLFTTKRQIGAIEGLVTESAATIVGISDPKSPAAKAGLQTFDIIESVDGKEVEYWRHIEPLVAKSLVASKAVVLSVRPFSQEGPSKIREVRIESKDLKIAAEQSALSQLGISRSDLFLLNIKPDSPAAYAGLKPGDQIKRIDGQEVTSWQTILDRVKSFNSEQSAISFTVSRSGEEKDLKISPEKIDLPTEQGAMESRYAIGVVPAILAMPNASFLQRQTGVFSALTYGVRQSWVWTKLIAISLVRLVQNEVSARNIGGVITIGRVASKSFEVGLQAFLKMMAIISINLFLLNLLPVPVLDGGHLLFFTVEALKGAPISLKKLEVAQQVGLVLLLSLMLFALFNDITNLLSAW